MNPRAAAGATAQLDHPLSLRLGGAPRAVAGSARSVPQARFALAAVAVAPFAHSLVVDLEPLRGSRHAPAVGGDEVGLVSGGREPPLYRSVRTVRDSLWSYGSHSPAWG